MKIFDLKKQLNNFTAKQRKEDHTIGLVPTMGALHTGHISLVKKALLENDLVVVSIFVNPTQFDKKDDLEKYPRTFEKDIELLKQVSDNIVVFAPTVDEIYDGNVTSESYEFDGLDKVMEGEFRTGHFDGVGTFGLDYVASWRRETNSVYPERSLDKLDASQVGSGTTFRRARRRLLGHFRNIRGGRADRVVRYRDRNIRLPRCCAV